MTNTKALMQILLSEGVPREIVFEFIEAAVETHLDEGTVEDFLLYGLVGAGIEIIAGSEVTQKVIKDGVEEILDSVNDIVLSPEAKELRRNARKNAKEATEEHIERTVKTNAKEKWEGGRDAGGVGRAGEGGSNRNLVDNLDEIANDIVDINKKYSDGYHMNNSIENILNSASYYDDAYEQVAATTRSITDHAFANGNKRTAFDTMNMLLDDFGLNNSLTDVQKWDLIYDIAEGRMNDVADIAKVLQGK